MSIKNIKTKRLFDILHKNYFLETGDDKSIEAVDIISEIFNKKLYYNDTIKRNKNQTNKKQRNNLEQQIIIEKWNQLFLAINKKK